MFLHSIIRGLLVWLRYIPKPDFSSRIVPTHPAPEEIKLEHILVVGDAKFQKWACFQCPGGCGERILLPLNQKRYPCWKITIDWLGRPTLYPSVRQLNQCRCHFWVRQGVVEWCPDSGGQAG
ncbi:MAG: hypothetical protein KME64_05310 [Scytonematopsis contorta HA4267-MV1]|jgi:hypothetical protein|nr:hypothetical protein [Scytonematopsis contorta HA4267-MV1]